MGASPDDSNSILVHFINHVLHTTHLKVTSLYRYRPLNLDPHLDLLLGGVLPQPLHEVAQLPGLHQAAPVSQGVKCVHDQDHLDNSDQDL